MSDLLILKRGIFHARLDIPADVREAFGNRKVLTKSLGTTSKSEANHKKYKFIELWKRQIAEARKKKNVSDKENWKDEALYVSETMQQETGALPIETMKFIELVEKHKIKSVDDRDELIDILTKKSTYTAKTIFTDARLKAYADFQHDRIIPKTIDTQLSRLKKLRAWLEKNDLDLNFDSVELHLNHLEHSQKTKKQYLFAYNSFFKWGKKYDKTIREKYKDLANPFESHDLREKLSTEIKERKAFTIAEIKDIHQKADDENLRNMIKIGAYTGMRIEELFKIKKSDIEKQENILFFNISRAKTKAGRRKVPIHSHIENLIEHYQKNNPNDEYLFPSPAGNKYGNRSDALSKRFGRHKTALGFGSEYVFHSLRKSLITELQRNNVDPLTITSVVGHKTNSITFDIYSAGPSLKQKSDAIESLNFEI
ncbi:site-specific integrase [Pseudomonas helleri]|uniref:site-specific integrase n=1 Tax=Pseudomonas helleri TaxID=1608996 RepID=UPI001885B8CC|nr:site-specific integrase [Pseudomonas helleri]